MSLKKLKGKTVGLLDQYLNEAESIGPKIKMAHEHAASLDFQFRKNDQTVIAWNKILE